MNLYFPFVLIPPDFTVISMAEERPFLLLAAVANACHTYPSLQESLHEEMKQMLTRRLTTEHGKDLDLLQGLLIHLAWFHYYSDPRSSQAYEYLQIAINMANDLGLNQDVLNGHSGFLKREANRALFGCCYLSHIVAVSTGNPSNLEASHTIIAAAESLSWEQEYPTDKLIYPLLRLQSFVEIIEQTYALGNTQICGLPGFFHALHLTKSVEEWWATLSMDIHSTVLLATSYRGFLIRIHQMGLAYRHGQKQTPQNNSAHTTMRAPPKISINLTKSVSFSKEYLDWIMVIPTNEYNKLPVAIWYQLILAITVLYKLSLGLSNIPGRDSGIAQQTANLEGYLGILSNRMRSTLTTYHSKPWPHTQRFFAMLSKMMDNTRNSCQTARSHSAAPRHKYRTNQKFATDWGPKRPASGAAPYGYPRTGIGRPQAAPDFHNNHQFQSSITADIQQIESDKLWNDFLATDPFLNGTNTSPISTPYSLSPQNQGNTCVETLFPFGSNLAGNTVNNPSWSLGS
ncbi:fungal specific transcription factor domain-containing protein [Aspergillus undulatus]|uniref:fungal specific transcription factor domain-containing protein n=1 Tax=Aspergillus undulatus TaxID=1810928 RepID=UPI003CCD1A30